MTTICDICKKHVKSVSLYVESGKTHKLCLDCEFEIEKTPLGNRINNKINEKKESWVTKNIREAKERREKGERLWT